MKDENAIWSNQHGFTKERSYLTSLISFYEEMISGWMRVEQWMLFILTIGKAFDIVSNNMLLEKLMKYGLDKKRVRRTENWAAGLRVL